MLPETAVISGLSPVDVQTQDVQDIDHRSGPSLRMLLFSIFNSCKVAISLSRLISST